MIELLVSIAGPAVEEPPVVDRNVATLTDGHVPGHMFAAAEGSLTVVPALEESSSCVYMHGHLCDVHIALDVGCWFIQWLSVWCRCLEQCYIMLPWLLKHHMSCFLLPVQNRQHEERC